MVRINSFLSISALLFCFAAHSSAAVITINFDGVADLSDASSLYSADGVNISSGFILVSGAFGGSLNELEFPPRSGEGVFLNDSDTTTLTFLNPITSFEAFFTYGGPITINFYDSSDSLLTTILSGFSTNVALSGDPGSSPNEQLIATGLASATRAEILATSADFTLDDLTFEIVETPGGSEVPEPATLSLAGGTLALLLYRFKKSSR